MDVGPRDRGAKAVTFVPGKAGHLVVGEKNGSLWVSHDDGATFTQAGTAAGGASIMSLAVGSKQSASTVFAGTSKGDVLVSTDAGDSWSKLGPGIPNDEITGLVPSSDYATDKTLWASTWHHGPYRSTDGAKTWTPAAKGVTTDPQADDLGFPQFGSIAVVPDSGNRQLYLVGYDGLFTSSDGGARWAQLQTLAEYLTGLAVSPDYANDGTVIVSSYVKGMFISRDGGRTFVGSNSGLGVPLAAGNKYLPVYRMHNVAFSPGYANDHTIFTATWNKFAKSTDGGRTWTLTVVAPKPKREANLQQYVLAVSPSYTSDHTIFMGTRFGQIWRSTKAGVARSWSHPGDVGLGVRSLVVSPDFAKDRTLFAGSTNGVFTSVDAGATWKATGPKGSRCSRSLPTTRTTEPCSPARSTGSTSRATGERRGPR